MIKKIFFLTITFLLFNIYVIKAEDIITPWQPSKNMSITGEFLRWDDRFEGCYILNLSYEVGEDVKYVFDKDTPYAIDIIEICADGEKLTFAVDGTEPPLSRSYFNVKETIEGKKEYYMCMYWDFAWVTAWEFAWESAREGKILSENINVIDGFAKALFWNDGKGMMFKDGLPWTNSYRILDGMKVLEITYRIILPYPSLTLENLKDKNYKNKIYTKEYKLTVDIGDLFTKIKIER